METWVVGDIHGESKKLKLAYLAAPIKRGDRIIFLGDYVDRGQDCFGVVDFIIGLKKYHEVILLRGNHDDEFLKGLQFGHYSMFNQGAREALKSYTQNCKPELVNSQLQDLRLSDLPQSHQDFFVNLLDFYQDDSGNLFVHAGIDRHKKISEQSSQTLLWDRDLLDSARSFHASNKKLEYRFKIADEKVNHIYVGHTPVQYYRKSTPQTYGPVTVLDLGAGKFDDGRVAFFNLETKQFYTN
jgi:serine/threonine protein phosphatase 1